MLFSLQGEKINVKVNNTVHNREIMKVICY